MPARKEPPLTPEAQHAKFVQAVRDIEAAGDLRDDTAERFERILASVIVEKTLDES